MAKVETKRSRGPAQVVFYLFVRLISQLLGVSLFNLRCIGREHTDVDGPAVILSTHQSHFDPALIGVTFNERLNYLAKRSLFDNWMFGQLIRLLDAIELDRDRGGLAGLKETLKRLKQGEKILIFPEGTRSRDGQIAPLKPGFLSVARRSRAPLIPIAITGAFDALPRGSRWPKRIPLRVAVGKPILPAEFADLDDAAMRQLIAERLEECYRVAERSRR